MNNRDRLTAEIFDVMENALALAGFRLLDNDNGVLIVRAPKEDRDFAIRVEEIPG